MNEKVTKTLWGIKKVLMKVFPTSVIDFLTLAIHKLDFKRNKKVKKVLSILADERSREVYNKLIKYRWTGNRKHFPIELYDDNQYFIPEIKIHSEEVFVDCGAFIGDTIDGFIAFTQRKGVDFHRAIGIEPTPDTFVKLSEHYKGNPRVTLYNLGVYDKDTELYFDADLSHYPGENKITDNKANSIRITVKSIDNINLDKITFLKMDIEGAELKALKGAEKTILRDKPKLAICIYHSEDDMVDIPLWIHKINPEYRLYIRQHSHAIGTSESGLCMGIAETVCYALLSEHIEEQ